MAGWGSIGGGEEGCGTVCDYVVLGRLRCTVVSVVLIMC